MRSYIDLHYHYPVNSIRISINHRLTNWGGQAYSYNANGNLLSDGQRSYTWNARNELSSLSPVGTSTVPPANFQYDPMGRRTGKTLNPASTPATTGYLYDGANFVQEINEANNTQSGTDAPQASLIANLLTAGIDSTLLRQRLTATGTTITASTPEHFLSDANNNTIAVTNAATTPAITTRYDYSAYGESTTTTVSGTQSDNSQQYTGRENDSTGLMYYRARYYNPACARFISEDPIGWASGQTNNYAYVGGDPVSMMDPSGLQSVTVGGFSGAGGEFTSGRDKRTCQGFINIRFGFGIGGGIKYDNSGAVPGGAAKNGGVTIGLFGDVSFTAPLIDTALQNNVNKDTSTSNITKQVMHPHFQFGKGEHKGLHVEAAAGGYITIANPPFVGAGSCKIP
jgi:RHS repeat-associated protein